MTIPVTPEYLGPPAVHTGTVGSSSRVTSDTTESQSSTLHLDEGSAHAVLYITPGAAGNSDYIADISFDGGAMDDTLIVLLRMEQAGVQQRVEGIREVPAVIFLGVAVVAIVVGLRSGKVRQDRPIGSGIGAAPPVAGALILCITNADVTPTALATNRIPPTEESISMGREVFLSNCSICHGPDGLGNGSRAAILAPPPANVTESYVDAHTDNDFYWWIQNGINPAMP